MILHTNYRIKILVLLGLLLCSDIFGAAQEDKLVRLEMEMLNYFSTKERDKFFDVTDDLKKASLESGDERLFYSTWSNQAIYESTLQYYQHALAISKEIMDYAKKDGSIYGEYVAMHSKAMILLQKQDYQAAEEAFLEAVDFHHRHYPNESAGDDLQELMRIANHRKDPKASARYALQIVNEPNVTPIHKGRALYRLSQMAFNKNDTAEFNRIYKEMQLLKETDGIGTLRPVVEVNHCILNGDYEQALQLADQLEEENRAERKALIYHRMGNDAEAFRYMQLYKRISDSITLVSHGNVVNSYYVQMNNDRLQLEQQMLKSENDKLYIRLYGIIGAVILIILLFFLWRGRKLIKSLRKDNKMLVYERKDAERALTDLHELSFFESKTELALTTPVKLNQLCNRLCDSTQTHCYKGVTVMFLTAFSDDFELNSDPEALKKLLGHLLHYSARFTHKGYIKLTCEDAGNDILFSVMDTSAGLGKKPTSHIIGMFSEQGNKVRYVGMNFNICQSITRLLCGRIWHDAEYTNGTRFCVELPKAPSKR